MSQFKLFASSLCLGKITHLCFKMDFYKSINFPLTHWGQSSTVTAPEEESRLIKKTTWNLYSNVWIKCGKLKGSNGSLSPWGQRMEKKKKGSVNDKCFLNKTSGNKLKSGGEWYSRLDEDIVNKSHFCWMKAVYGRHVAQCWFIGGKKGHNYLLSKGSSSIWFIQLQSSSAPLIVSQAFFCMGSEKTNYKKVQLPG